MSIRLVAGLGNPGPEYAETRHNIGFKVIDLLAAKLGSKWQSSPKWEAVTTRWGDTLFIKPMSFMNRSGLPIFVVAQFYKIAPEEILVVLDDLALPLGRIRMRPEGGTGGHNGLESILLQFGTEKIPRLRVGIGTAPRDGGVDYVLGRFSDEEKPLLTSAIESGAESVKWAIDNGLVSAMNKFNKAEES